MSTTTLFNQILVGPAAPQDTSPLFTVLPAEVRSNIFSFALTDYPDPSPDKHYNASTIYTRPTYFAPRKNDAQLLQTCRAVYRECWFMPFVLKEHTHWIGHDDRAPPHYSDHSGPRKLSETLKQIAEQQGENNVEVETLRVFAQMWKLEEGGLAKLLEIPHLHPRNVTLTIRHADWWWWEDDEPLCFEGKWIKRVSKALSPSVREVCIEIESIKRKKGQIDAIAKQMIERWFFKRPDGVILYADTTGGSRTEDTWTGSSTWQQKRWIRDETEEGKIEYHVVAITFRPQSLIERRGGKISDVARGFAQNDIYDMGKLKLHLPEEKRMICNEPYTFTSQERGEWRFQDEFELTDDFGHSLGWGDSDSDL
ncbi:hypothetical protein G7Z17_g1389 [Cylindrodendrum hubeiense]|uniref:Uncharacterized protein n=1 Tax=Cylindrodendrum hubeiense TaxID=595255 RepID=A0A9P5HG20_9HYPO|nr:hypothetical protein G7Z17_g1389 [Cylindrodendrum hubeiense]